MRIAVAYDNGNVFQHFGRTEFFKVYEVEDNKVISSEVIGSIPVTEYLTYVLLRAAKQQNWEPDSMGPESLRPMI